jgi:hypothetical protein
VVHEIMNAGIGNGLFSIAGVESEICGGIAWELIRSVASDRADPARFLADAGHERPSQLGVVSRRSLAGWEWVRIASARSCRARSEATGFVVILSGDGLWIPPRHRPHWELPFQYLIVLPRCARAGPGCCSCLRQPA